MNKYSNEQPTQTHEIPSKDKQPSDFKFGNKVVYIPHHLLVGNHDNMVQDENLGYVTGWAEELVFVRYNRGKDNLSKATSPKDLFWLDNREDLKV